ncbi:MAG TPA: TIGR03435 family protein, partial [Acidobacteriaceae bacterium]
MKRAMVWVMAAAVSGMASVQAQDKPVTAQGTPATASTPAQVGDLTGNWQGTLAVGNGLRLLVKVLKGTDGKYKAVMYSIDQGGQAIGANSFDVQGSTVTLGITGLELKYTATLSADDKAMTGNFVQHGDTHPLDLARVSDENAWAIPEAPKPMAKDAKPGFEVVTIKPRGPDAKPGKNIGFQGRHFIGRNFNVDDLLALAYGLHTKQIIGAPDWFNSELYDIDGIPDVPGVPSQAQIDIMLQKLLADRFGLKFHHEQRELSVFAINVAKNGPKIQVTTAAGPDDGIGFGFRSISPANLSVRNMTITDFGKWMQASVMDRPVVDQTGLKDRYDFTLNWSSDDSQFAQFRSTGAFPTAKDDPNAPPALNDAMQQ